MGEFEVNFITGRDQLQPTNSPAVVVPQSAPPSPPTRPPQHHSVPQPSIRPDPAFVPVTAALKPLSRPDSGLRPKAEFLPARWRGPCFVYDRSEGSVARVRFVLRPVPRTGGGQRNVCQLKKPGQHAMVHTVRGDVHKNRIGLGLVE